ncbi:TraK family protein [Azospirillum oleiclasticum]
MLCREILSNPNASPRARNVAVIRTYRADIEAALADGWSILETWRVMSADGRVTSAYQSFRKCVNRFILGKQPPPRRRVKNA